MPTKYSFILYNKEHKSYIINTVSFDRGMSMFFDEYLHIYEAVINVSGTYGSIINTISDNKKIFIFIQDVSSPGIYTFVDVLRVSS